MPPKRKNGHGPETHRVRKPPVLPPETLPFNVEEFIPSLHAAVQADDAERVNNYLLRLYAALPRLCLRLPLDFAARVLKCLRGGRFFDKMVRAVEEFGRYGITSPTVRRQHAQALIELHSPQAALGLLEWLTRDPATPPEELDEARGLKGRIYKQYYIHACKEPESGKDARKEGALVRRANGRPGGARKAPETDQDFRNEDALVRSACAYYEVFRPLPPARWPEVYEARPDTIWHAINLLALLHAAAEPGRRCPVKGPDGTRLDDIVNIKDVARDLLAAAMRQHEAAERTYEDAMQRWRAQPDGGGSEPQFNYWPVATATEACLALEDYRQALALLGKYVTNPKFEDFAKKATWRQFVFLWRLSRKKAEQREILKQLRIAMVGPKLVFP